MTTIVTEQPWWGKVTIYHGEDWDEAIPQFVDAAGAAFDLTGKYLEWIARPSYDFDTRFVFLTSVGSAGIVIDNAVGGLASFARSQALIEAELPVSSDEGWDQFLRIGFTDPLLGARKKLIWRGPLMVYPGRDDA